MNDPTLFQTDTRADNVIQINIPRDVPTDDEYRAQMRAAGESYSRNVKPRFVAAARPSDPDTSRAAAESLNPTRVRDTQRQILAVLGLYGPSSDEQIAEHYERLAAHEGWGPQSPSGLRTRRRELVDAGLVVDSGQRTTTASGRQTIVWELNASRL